MSNAPGRGSRYFLHIEELPQRYTWQDLKDLVRTQASHGVWTEMMACPSGSKSSKGYARVQRLDEARSLYKFLTEMRVEGRALRVHLWDISTVPARFSCCNCSGLPQGHHADTMDMNMVMSDHQAISSPRSSDVATTRAAGYPTTSRQNDVGKRIAGAHIRFPPQPHLPLQPVRSLSSTGTSTADISSKDFADREPTIVNGSRPI